MHRITCCAGLCSNSSCCSLEGVEVATSNDSHMCSGMAGPALIWHEASYKTEEGRLRYKIRDRDQLKFMKIYRTVAGCAKSVIRCLNKS